MSQVLEVFVIRHGRQPMLYFNAHSCCWTNRGNATRFGSARRAHAYAQEWGMPDFAIEPASPFQP